MPMLGFASKVCNGDIETLGDGVSTGSDSDRVAVLEKSRLGDGREVFLTVLDNVGPTRSLPPPHAGCPRGDPGSLPVLTPWPG